MNNSAYGRTFLALLLTLSLLTPPRASAADQSCSPGVKMDESTSESVSSYKADVNVNLGDYGVIFQGVIFQSTSPLESHRSWESARDALINKIDSTIAAGSRYDAVVRKTVGPYQGWLEGANVSLIMASGLMLADRPEIFTPELDSAIRRVIGSYVFNRDAGCGLSDGRWRGPNSCMDDYAVAASGLAWIAAYKHKRGDGDAPNYANAAKNSIALALSLEESVCAYRTNSTWESSHPRGPCQATVSELSGGQAEVVSLNHGQQSIAYGLGLMTSVSSAVIGLQTAGATVNWTTDQRAVALGLLNHYALKVHRLPWD